ncbi:hypothetical protein EG329_000355 [Mollisiaceae sp. DMI_Dod_QoI]|nr:hypothetical protein EG329_000355 [Helotiales sp. DMI_Dod_QoI]
MAPSSPSLNPTSNDKLKGKEKENSLPSSLSSNFRRNKSSKLSVATPILTPSPTRPDNGVLALRYEETTAAKAPIAVIKAPPRQEPNEIHPALRRPKTGVSVEDQRRKRDSGLAPTTSSKARTGSVAGSTIEVVEKELPLGVKIDFDSNSVIANKSQSAAPMFVPLLSNEPLKKSETRSSGVGSAKWRKPSSKKSNNNTAKSPTESAFSEDYSPITTPIPTDNLIDDEWLRRIEFSKRGSIMLLGKNVLNGHARANATRRQPSFSMLASSTSKMLPEDIEKESQKVRSMYEQGAPTEWEAGKYSSLAQKANGPAQTEDSERSDFLAPPTTPFERSESVLSIRSEHELAGGIEDWEDVEGSDVDRYGFIDLRRKVSRPGTPEPKIHRVSTVLQLASDAPRKKRTFGRATSLAASASTSQNKAPSRKVSARSLATQGSDSSQRSTGGRMRAVSNRLPGNKDRRWMDEAGDMLTLPPGLADIAEDEEGGKAATALKHKEAERTEKWRKMAKVVKVGKDGAGMEFEFDPRNSKLIERTWKGIPDRWRAAAWYSFLAASAKKRQESVPDKDLIVAFNKLQSQSSADDVQIDLDVPRTINSHIMFRRRYRGGQRLLFRVLHAISLYFPKTGYVQGMASLAATLLCYYEEEQAFVMLVRMWTLRGLDKLYESGFPGLMAALEEFQTKWLAGSKVSKKLNELSIEPTAYGTRWYLTLFNYSIPFPAQLRVWDVFMLLGDIDETQTATTERPFQGGLDVLHATSAALIDGTREILMDSDFENAMKVLTSWIPVKDEELLMKVTRAEWKIHHKGRRA